MEIASEYLQKKTQKKLHNDHSGEFENSNFDTFCRTQGIKHEFSFPQASPQNEVVDMKNHTLQEMARIILHEYETSQGFWAKVVNTTCYVLNRVLIRPIINKTPYELWKNKKPKISYFKVFGSKSFVLCTIGNQDKFSPKSDEGIFIGYSLHSKAYRVFIKSSQT